MANTHQGKSILITGANGKLGKETCKWLVKDGSFSRIVMCCRSESKGQAARDEVLRDSKASDKDVTIEFRGGFDMTDPSAIDSAVEALPANEKPFDVIFLQVGGVVLGKKFSTVNWNGLQVERTVFQNAIGGHVTLSALKKRGLLAPGARVVAAGGEGARGVPGFARNPKFDSPGDLRRYTLEAHESKEKYSAFNAIAVSKLVSALWVRKLARRPEGAEDVNALTVVWFSPGLTYGTYGLLEKPPVQRFFMENVLFGMMRGLRKAQSPRNGARKYADCLESKIGNNGDLIGAPKGTALGKLVDQSPMNPAFDDEELQDEVWKIFEEVCGPFAA